MKRSRSWKKRASSKKPLNKGGPHTFPPHHPSVRTDKSTRKIRPVYNASYRPKGGYSLNDLLDIGSNLVPNIVDVLQSPIAFITDIEQAFLQIELPEDNANAMRFLWTRSKTDNNVVAYSWRRLPFGLGCSSFILQAVVRKLLQEHS